MVDALEIDMVQSMSVGALGCQQNDSRKQSVPDRKVLNKFLTVGEMVCYITHPLVTEVSSNEDATATSFCNERTANRGSTGQHLSPLLEGRVCVCGHAWTLTSVHTEIVCGRRSKAKCAFSHLWVDERDTCDGLRHLSD